MVSIEPSASLSRREALRRGGTKDVTFDGSAAAHLRATRVEWGGRDAVSLYGGGCQLSSLRSAKDLQYIPPFEWKDPMEPRTVLVAIRCVEAGEEILVKYSDLGCEDSADVDFWRLRWGFCDTRAHTATRQQPQRRKRRGLSSPSTTLKELDELACDVLKGVTRTELYLN